MKTSGVCLLFILLICLFLVGGKSPEESRTLVQLAKQMIDAVKKDDFGQFEKCWVKPQVMIDYIKKISTKEELSRAPNMNEYFEKSRKAIKPFYVTFQAKIKSFGLDKKDIVYQSMSCQLKHDIQHGSKINSMKIRFYFKGNKDKIYSIRIDDGFYIDSRVWGFTDKPIQNMK